MIFEVGLPRRICETKKEAVEFINKYNGIKALYRTVYDFDSMNENKINYNSAIINSLFFDFDGEDCWKEANKLHQFLLKEDIKHKLIMSGRGYHIFVYTELYRPKNSKSCIYNGQHYFIDLLNLKCDMSIVGDIARLCRISNTYNIKAKLFCIPLTKDQFKSGDEVIKIVARKQHFIKDIFIGNKLFDIKKFDHKADKTENIIDISKFESNLNVDYISASPDFIKQLLAKEEHGWNDRFLIIMYFKERGCTRQEVLEILKTHLSERKFKHCIYEERQLQYLFERNDLVFPEKYAKIYK